LDFRGQDCQFLVIYWVIKHYQFISSRAYSTSTGSGNYQSLFSNDPAAGEPLPPNNPGDLPRELTFTNLHEPETREAARKALAGKGRVYCIRCLKDNKCYVGSAVNLYERMCEHLWHNGGQSNILLQRAIGKHGLENLEFFVISFVAENSQLIAVEQKYLDMVPSNFRYNIAQNALAPMAGRTHTAETRAAMSKAQVGNTNSVGNRGRTGMPHSAEAKAAIGAASSKHILCNTYRALSVYVNQGVSFLYCCCSIFRCFSTGCI
jgi:group I intron endonuclease